MLMGLTSFGQHKAMLYVGRIMTGLMNGAATPASQIYVNPLTQHLFVDIIIFILFSVVKSDEKISECSSPRVRGTLSSLTATALSLGILTTYVIGAFVEWNVLAFIIGSFPFVLLVGMIFMPETPGWLLAHNQEEEAKKSLQSLRGRY